MKPTKVIKNLLLVLALLAVSVPATAAMDSAGNMRGGKDECLLNLLKCPDPVPWTTVKEKAALLEREISKGGSVYTPDELNQLKKEHERMASYHNWQIYYQRLNPYYF